jgi:cysteine desulfurase family protein (TIGR01976 family)
MFNPDLIRSHFPALGSGAIFLDNPGGTQVTQRVIDAVQHYFLQTNANHAGAFRTSRDSDMMVAEARSTIADFLNANRPEEIIFGQNMTSLTLHMSRSLARILRPGDEIVVTRLDHDANIAPWLLIAKDCGCSVRWVDFNPGDCTWDIEALKEQITPRTKIVAVGFASNAVGTINPVREAVEVAHKAGAICFIDAVQYAPHGPIDVQILDCDFLVWSAYKCFGPHLGILYGRYDLLSQLTAYKVRPAEDSPPHKFETGTQNFEAIVGTLGALEYLQWIGEMFGSEFEAQYAYLEGRKLTLKKAMHAIRRYELSLSRALIEQLNSVPGLRIRGITGLNQLDQRVPTVSFTLEDWHPRQLAKALDLENVYVWDGNYYALAVTERLELEDKGGMVRVGAVHYNTVNEIERLVNILRGLRS